MTIFTFRITVTRLATGRIGNIPVILIAFITVVTNNVRKTFLAHLPCGTFLTSAAGPRVLITLVWTTVAVAPVGRGNGHGHDEYQQTSRTDSDDNFSIFLHLCQYAAGVDGGWGGGGLWGR